MLTNPFRDVRRSFRRLLQRPGLAAVAVLALGVGIGLTTAMFSIVDGVLLRGLPFEEPQELMAISRIIPAQGQAQLFGRIHDLRDLRERQSTFEGIAGFTLSPINVSAPGQDPEFANASRVTPNLFDLLRAKPLLGRAFGAGDGEPGAPATVLLGYRFWQDRLQGDPEIVGEIVRVDGLETTVIGVMPEGFQFPINQELWVPLRVDIDAIPRGEGPGLLMIGRLGDGITVEQAQGDLERIMTQLGEEHPDTNQGMSVLVGPYVRQIVGNQLPAFLYTMLGAVGFVLLIACANVANLLLARASQRTRDLAIHSALGARRREVFLQLLTDAAVIALLGAGVGLVVAQAGLGLFNAAVGAQPQGVPFWFQVGIDPRALAFVLTATLAATLLSGAIPALQASRADVGEILKDSSRGSSSLKIGRLSRGLVFVEVAMSCALLVAAGLMVRSISNLANEDYAFDETGLLVANVALPAADYPDPDSWRQFYDRLDERLEALPGAEDATVGTDLPAIGFTNGRFAVQGRSYQRDSDYPTARIGAVETGYFDALRVGPLEGRAFTEADGVGGMPVAVVNRSFVRTHFDGDSPIGERVAVRAVTGGEAQRRDDLWYTIVGVVPDLYLDLPGFPLGPEALYVPFAHRPSAAASIAVRTSGDPLTLTSAVREAVTGLDPDLPISQVNSLEQAIADGQVFLRVFASMFGIFGGVALFLATIGLYGVLAFSVSQRTHEVGLRIALGAAPGDVRRMVLRQGMLQVAVGLAVGLLMAVGLGRLLTMALYEVSPADPLVLAGITVVLLLTGLLACWIPATRATRVDPLTAMRAE